MKSRKTLAPKTKKSIARFEKRRKEKEEEEAAEKRKKENQKKFKESLKTAIETDIKKELQEIHKTLNRFEAKIKELRGKSYKAEAMVEMGENRAALGKIIKIQTEITKLLG
jgi:hypothetical protein